MPKRILEGTSPSDRALKRRQLGTLKQLTVQPSTRNRYRLALDKFLAFLKFNDLILPHRRDLLDPLVCEYIEHLWFSGEGKALASDTVASLQDFDAHIKGRLPGAWRLLKTWALNEVPNRAPPFPDYVVHAMCGWACLHQHFSFAVSLLVGFYGMLRTGELLNVKRKDFATETAQRKVLLSLGMTKGGKRAGAAESVVLGFDQVVSVLKHWMSLAPMHHTLTPAPHKWRALFTECLEKMKITGFGFRPYSLRRGGATYWFAQHHSLDKLLLDGRWQAAKTARLYVNEGLSVLAQLELPRTDPRLVPFLQIYRQQFLSLTFATLEPPPKIGRAGGRGKSKRAQKPKKSFRCKTV